jgi:hypothetical protein
MGVGSVYEYLIVKKHLVRVAAVTKPISWLNLEYFTLSENSAILL